VGDLSDGRGSETESVPGPKKDVAAVVGDAPASAGGGAELQPDVVKEPPRSERFVEVASADILASRREEVAEGTGGSGNGTPRTTVPKAAAPQTPPLRTPEEGRLAVLEAQCQRLEQGLNMKELERQELEQTLRDKVRNLEEAASRTARELQRKERQVDELNSRSTALSKQLAERESEAMASAKRAAELEREVSRLGGRDRHSSRSRRSEEREERHMRPEPELEGNEVMLASKSDHEGEEPLDSMPTLAALRQRLSREVDGSTGRPAAGAEVRPLSGRGGLGAGRAHGAAAKAQRRSPTEGGSSGIGGGARGRQA